MPTRMDAAVTVDAQNASTATWKTAQRAVSHSAHTLHRSTHEIPDTPFPEHLCALCGLCVEDRSVLRVLRHLRDLIPTNQSESLSRHSNVVASIASHSCDAIALMVQFSLKTLA